MLVLALPAMAATFTVNSTLDSHDTVPGDGVCEDELWACTFRAAVEESNGRAGDDVVDLTGLVGSVYLGSTGDPTLDEEPVRITSSMDILGDATGIVRYLPLDGYGTLVPYTLYGFDYRGGISVVVEDAGVGPIDVSLSSVWFSADMNAGHAATIYLGEPTSTVRMDSVDFLFLNGGVNVAGNGVVEITGSLFYGNYGGDDPATLAGGYGGYGIDMQGNNIRLNQSYLAFNTFGALAVAGVVTGSDFRDNGTAIILGSQLARSSHNTFVENYIGVDSRGGLVGTSSFSGNVLHLATSSDAGRTNLVHVTFGPNDGGCSPPVLLEGPTTTVDSIFTAPECGVAACDGVLSGFGTNLVENRGDPLNPSCRLAGVGTWLSGDDTAPLDAGLDAVQPFRTFYSDAFGYVGSGDAPPLLSASPAVDAGATRRRADLVGTLFLLDGNGDGVRGGDLGALELVP